MAGPCDLRAELQVCIDDARQLIDDFGLRVELVEILTQQWSGAPGLELPQDFQYGLGASTQLSRITITPKPIVSVPRPKLVASSPGTYLEGDRIISKVTRVLTEADLDLPADAVGGEKIERFYLIDGLYYRQERELEKKNFEWVIHVRRTRDRKPPNVIP